VTEYRVTRPIGRLPTHPGQIWREDILPALGLSVDEAARRMRVERSEFAAVLDGAAAVTADMALRFAYLTGGTPELFLRMQLARDLWEARARLADTLEEIEPAVR
jgi:addiction module HigA family antidote